MKYGIAKAELQGVKRLRQGIPVFQCRGIPEVD